MHYCLIYPIRKVRRKTEVCLGYMKTGTWQGYFNGFGGKVENEAPVNAAIRELREETCIQSTVNDLKYRGHVMFREENPILVDVFTISLGRLRNIVPKITEVAIPCWFYADQLPFEVMPPHDRYFIDILTRSPNHLYSVTIFTKNGEAVKVDVRRED